MTEYIIKAVIIGLNMLIIIKSRDYTDLSKYCGKGKIEKNVRTEVLTSTFELSLSLIYSRHAKKMIIIATSSGLKATLIIYQYILHNNGRC